MKIAMIAPEIAPFAKTGGLADVVGTLSLALERRGHELCVIMPAYRSALRGGFTLEETPRRLLVSLSDRTAQATLVKTRLGHAIVVYMVRADAYFDRDYLYGTADADYADNAERFVFFSRAALEILRDHTVDIVHCHDWQAALPIVFLKTQGDRYPEIAAARTLFTVHNLGFQGIFPASVWSLLDLPHGYFSPQYLEFYGKINFVKGSLLFADKITTVSPAYAKEIMGSEQGFGLEGVLQQRTSDIVGILNGVDYSQWSPAVDSFIAQHYSENALTAKRICKQSLQRNMGLPANSSCPLVGMVSRLTSQKGFDLVEKSFDKLMEMELQFVLLGSGELHYEEFFRAAAGRFPDRVAVRIGFDEALAHQIEAGADIFLMPSLYEPCGLNQMFSLKYGTIPVVRAIGGLKDTVEDYDAPKRTGTGFVFGPYETEALLVALGRAVQVFREKQAWTALRRRAMSRDFSWERSAQAYSDLYQELLP
jgi:starch synthase